MAHPLDPGNPELDRVLDDLDRRTVGKRSVLERMLCALLAGGHVLLEDVPGTGKTFVVKALAAALGLQFKRIQCTPDLLPSDIVGMTVYRQHTAEFTFVPGPVFSHVLLVDEINRSSPRTQAALLEAMEERQVTVDGVTHPLPVPFMVLATENPLDAEDAFPLPTSQLDRFLFRLAVGYPTVSEEAALLRQTVEDANRPASGPILDRTGIESWQQQSKAVRVSDSVLQYMAELLALSRRDARVRWGASPRAGAQWLSAAQSWALLKGRSYIIPEDIQELAQPVLAHRLLARSAQSSVTDALASWMLSASVPRPPF